MQEDKKEQGIINYNKMTYEEFLEKCKGLVPVLSSFPTFDNVVSFEIGFYSKSEEEDPESKEIRQKGEKEFSVLISSFKLKDAIVLGLDREQASPCFTFKNNTRVVCSFYEFTNTDLNSFLMISLRNALVGYEKPMKQVIELHEAGWEALYKHL